MNSTKATRRWHNFILPLLFFYYLWLLWSVSPLFAQDARPFPAHIDTAISYFGFQDLPDQNNYGPAIKKFLASVGLPEGYPYCAAFISYCLSVAGAEKPTVRSALASDFIRPNSISAKDVMMRRKKIPSGSIGIYRRGNTKFGHAVFVLLEWSGSTGITIEGNTTTGSGNEFNGNGVWIRQRTIYPLNYFRLTHFTQVRYEK